MLGFRKYIAKILIVVIGFTNTFPATAYAAQPVSGDVNQPLVNDQSAPVSQDVQPVTALPQHSSKLSVDTSILALASNDGSGRSARMRRGVSVQKLERHDFKADEDITLTLDNPDQETYKTKITDASGKVANVQFQQDVQGGITQLQVIPTNQFQPGKYTISVTDQTGKTTKQDFSWGVLALNPDKAIYQPNETSDLAMAVLDDRGAMVCNAQVELQVKNQALGINETLSTDNKKIKVNNECSSHAFTLKPDYEASYQLGGVGTYDLTLTAKTGSGSHTITDQIQVAEGTPFEIQRKSATRIYPPNEYPMQLNITANRDFTGTITETVPDSFAITPADGNKSYDGMKTVYLNNNDPSTVLGASTGGLVMPFDGTYPITQGFGSQLTDPTLQAFYSHYGLGGHDGIDFGLPMGTPLYAVDAGKVVWSGPGDYGTQVIIQHSWGKTYYGHMSKTVVEKDTDVNKGSLIGYSGMTGEATGPHLHFGMKPDKADMSNGYSGKVDPMPYLPIGGSGLGTRGLGLGLNSILGASTSAEASESAAIPTPSASSSAVTQSPVPSPQSQTFTIGDAVSQQAAEDQPQSLSKMKVIKWHVSLKKGDKINLSYNYKTPRISPQFYLLGSLKFYTDKHAALAFDEGRQWQIAADDIGTGWYHPSTNPNSGYEWPYRKKLTIDHTKVGVVSGPPVIDQISSGTSTLNQNITWSHTVSAGLSNSVLVVTVGNDNTGPLNVNTVTYNGAGLTRITGASKTQAGGSANATSEIWYMMSPPAGTASVVVHYASSSIGNVGGAASFSNVDQITPFGTAATAGGTTSSSSVSITTSTNQTAIESLGTDANTPYAVKSGQTQISNGTGGGGSYGRGTGTTMGWTLGSASAWAEVAVPINGASSGSDQSNFPVLVSLPNNANLLAHETRTNADDLIFTDSGGETKLESEIESYNTTNGTLVAWVKIPALSASSDTSFYMYYGNGSAPIQSSTSVWDANTRMVQHLGTLARGSPNSCNTYNDSTGNTFNMTCSATVPTTTTGQIDSGLSFNGSSALLTGSASVDDSMTSGVTVSGWFNTTTVAAANATILRNDGGTAATVNSKGFFLQRLTNHISGGVWANAGSRVATGATTLTTGTWYYGALTYNGTNVIVYLNGAQDGTTATTGSITTSATALTAASSNGGAFFSGSLDELHVSDTARSASWISTEYANQNSPSTFIPTVGNEETDVTATTNDRLMRHGKFFDTNTTYGKQPFLF